MFQDLYAVARHTALTLIVTPQGDKLSVIITPHPGKDGAKQGELSTPIQAVGTPEELDAELPGRLREYAEAVNSMRLKLDLPTAAIAAAATAAKPKATAARSTPARKAKKPAKAKPAKKATATPRVKLPDVTRLRTEARERRRTKPTPRAGLPTREDLVVACRALIAKHGVEKIDREFYIRHVKSGRRYERLFETFKEMVALAEKPAAATQRTVSVQTVDAKADEQVPIDPPPGAVPSTTVLHTEPDAKLVWPFPTTSRP